MAAWTLAIWVVWLRAHVRLSSRGPYEVPNRYQGALALRKSIDEDFAEHGKPTAMSDKDFSLHCSKTLMGGSVRNHSVRPIIASKVGVWANTKKWLKGEKWWCIAFAIETLWLSLGWMALQYSFQRLIYYGYYVYRSSAYRSFEALEGFYSITLWAWPSVIFAMIIGTTTKSRLFFISCWVVIGLVILISLFSV